MLETFISEREAKRRYAPRYGVHSNIISGALIAGVLLVWLERVLK